MSLMMVAVILATHLMTPVAAYLVRRIGDPSGAEQSGEDPIFMIKEEI